MHIRRALLILSATLGVAGCASVRSTYDTEPNVDDGLVYFMPKRDIVVSITVPPRNPQANTGSSGSAGNAGGARNAGNAGNAGSAGDSGNGGDAGTAGNAGNAGNARAPQNPQVHVITVEAGPAYPDTLRRFVLDYQRNFVGTNKLDIKVNERGLLDSAGSTTTTGVSDMLSSLASALGSQRTLGINAFAPPGSAPCEPGQTYTRVIKPEQLSATIAPLCDFDIAVESLAADTLWESSARIEENANKVQSGVFYRQGLPYQVTVSQQANGRDFLVFSPSAAPISYLPIRRSVFADNEAKLLFTNGMPTGYEQSVDGEVVGFLKLPASVIEAYFSAIGSMFEKIKSNASNEQEYLEALNQLALAQLGRVECETAVSNYESAEDMAAIRAACGVEE